jgi:hypothetical protein
VANADIDDTTKPTVSITSPALPPANVYRVLTYASGTASDNKALAKVTVRIFHYADTSIPTAGYVAADGSISATYNPAIHELTATGLASWIRALPTL